MGCFHILKGTAEEVLPFFHVELSSFLDILLYEDPHSQNKFFPTIRERSEHYKAITIKYMYIEIKHSLTNRHTQTHRVNVSHVHTQPQTQTYIHRQTNRQTDRQTHRQTHIDTLTHQHTHIHKHRHRHTHIPVLP